MGNIVANVVGRCDLPYVLRVQVQAKASDSTPHPAQPKALTLFSHVDVKTYSTRSHGLSGTSPI